jgi:hypothetical protein
MLGELGTRRRFEQYSYKHGQQEIPYHFAILKVLIEVFNYQCVVNRRNKTNNAILFRNILILRLPPGWRWRLVDISLSIYTLLRFVAMLAVDEVRQTTSSP